MDCKGERVTPPRERVESCPLENPRSLVSERCRMEACRFRGSLLMRRGKKVGWRHGSAPRGSGQEKEEKPETL